MWFFFGFFLKDYKNKLTQESSLHLEEINNSISLSIQTSLNTKWNIVTAIKVSCDHISNIPSAELKKFLKFQKNNWQIDKLVLYTKDGSMFDDQGNPIQIKNTLSTITSVLQNTGKFWVDGSQANFIIPLNGTLSINDLPIIALQTTFDIEKTTTSVSMGSFNDQANFFLIQSDGKEIIHSKNLSNDALTKMYKAIDNGWVKVITGMGNPILTELKTGKKFTTIYNENGINKYLVATPLILSNTVWYLLFIVPQEVVNRDTTLFTSKIIKVSIFIIALFCLIMIYLTLLIYQINSRSIKIFLNDKQKTQNEALKEALTLAQQANSAKTKFLSNMSHDIRTPMNAIICMTDFALAEPNNELRVKEYLSIVKQSSQHLLHLINDILDMTRIESGKLILKNDQFNLKQEISEVSDMIKPAVTAKNQIFNVVFKDIQHYKLQGDKLHLNRILINLLTNANKFTKPNGRIELRIQELPSLRENTANYRFTVSDNGIGINKENLSNIFQPFTREERIELSTEEGSGLGLSITKNIVSAMGGDITVKSEINEGSVFTVELFFPLQKEEAISNEVTTSPSLEESLFSKTNFNGINALIAEDNVVNRIIIQKLLESIHINCFFEVNGELTVNNFLTSEKDFYSIILMDIQMPIMNGYEATALIRNSSHLQAKTIPIVAMSANVFDEDIEKCRKVGMNAHLGKPIDVDKLATVLNRLILNI